MSKLSPEAQAIVDAGRAAHTPSAASQAKVLAALEHSLLESGAGASSSAVAASQGGIGKVLIVSGLVAAIGVGYFVWRSQSTSQTAPRGAGEERVLAAEVAAPTPAPSQVLVAAPELEVPDEATIPEVIAPAPRETEPAPRKTRGKRSKVVEEDPQPAAVDDLLAEQKLIGAAQKATRDGDYQRAQSLLAQHRREYASGVLAPERDATMAIATCLSGDLEAGQAAASRFLVAHPSSPLAGQVRKSCQQR